MRKYLILTSLLTLTACMTDGNDIVMFGNNDTNGVISKNGITRISGIDTPDSVLAQNADVTTMEPWINSAHAVIDYVEKCRINLDSSSGTGAKVAISPQQIEAFTGNDKYNRAVAELQNAIAIYNGDKIPETEQELRNALLLLLYGREADVQQAMLFYENADDKVHALRDAYNISSYNAILKETGFDHHFEADERVVVNWSPSFADLRQASFFGIDDAVFRFSLNADGIITGIRDGDLTSDRVGTTNQFTYHNDEVDAKTTIDSYAKNKLKYSDFGLETYDWVELDTGKPYHEVWPFYGGYANQEEFDFKYNNSENYNFSGGAVGVIAHDTVSGDTDWSTVKTDKATMVINNGEYVVNMPFHTSATEGDFYDVSLIGYGTDHDAQMIFKSGYTGNHKFSEDDGSSFSRPAWVNIGASRRDIPDSEEVVGGFSTDGSDEQGYMINFRGAFGMTRQE